MMKRLISCPCEAGRNVQTCQQTVSPCQQKQKSHAITTQKPKSFLDQYIYKMYIYYIYIYIYIGTDSIQSLGQDNSMIYRQFSQNPKSLLVYITLLCNVVWGTSESV